MHYPIHTAVKGLNKRGFTTCSGAASCTEYAANALNQYTAEGSFAPAFDADSNQTLVKTSTSIWRVSYNAKNRPVRFVKDDETATVECIYDSMGRRDTKKVTLNGAVTEHRRFLYRGYLCISACDLTRADSPTLWLLLWDETAPTATRPLGILRYYVEKSVEMSGNQLQEDLFNQTIKELGI